MFCVLGHPTLGSIEPDIARKVMLEGRSAQMVPMDWYASQKLRDQGMTRCALSIMQNLNLSLKILDSSITLKADMLILSGAQLMISVMVHLVRMPPTISDHLRLRPPTLQCHSDAHCISSHNHTTPVAGLNSDQCLISLDLVPMSRATAYLSFSPYATFA